MQIESLQKQEWIAFGIVFLAFVFLVRAFLSQVLRDYLAQPVSQWFLKRGQVKFAMFFRKKVTTSKGCSNCSCH